MNVRRVVTGHSSDSKAVFASDSIVEPHVAPGVGFEFLKLWGAENLPSFPDAGSPSAYRDYFPPVGGFRFGIFTIPAVQATPLAKEERKIAYARMEEMFPGLPAHMESTSPGMHTSDSIDFGYVIAGSIWLELDDGSVKELHAGDTYVQNGTRHAWAIGVRSRAASSLRSSEQSENRPACPWLRAADESSTSSGDV